MGSVFLEFPEKDWYIQFQKDISTLTGSLDYSGWVVGLGVWLEAGFLWFSLFLY